MKPGKVSSLGSRLWLAALLLAPACQRDDPGSLVLLGTLERETVSLTAPVSEVLLERPVHEGQRIAAGALVGRLDDARLRAETAIHAAALDRARAYLAELQAGTTREVIAQAEAETAGATAAEASARSELRRVEKLFREKLVPQSDLDRARSGAKEAEARKQRTAQFLAEQRRGPRVEALDGARAQLAQAEAQLREVGVRLAQLELRAPADSIVESLPFQVGERPPVGAILAVLAPDSAPYARVFVPQRAVGKLRQDQSALASVDGVASDLAAKFRFVASEAMFTPVLRVDRRGARPAGLSGEGGSRRPASTGSAFGHPRADHARLNGGVPSGVGRNRSSGQALVRVGAVREPPRSQIEFRLELG